MPVVMKVAAQPDNLREALVRFACAGAVTAAIDGLFSSVLNVAVYGSTVARLFQGVASTLVGASAFNGGIGTTSLGLLMHIGVAFFWSAVFVFIVLRSAIIKRVLTSPYGPLRVALAYGPAIWLVMSLLVIPILLRRMPSISIRWWVQLFGHFPFVGLPIVALATMRLNRSERQAAPALGSID